MQKNCWWTAWTYAWTCLGSLDDGHGPSLAAGNWSQSGFGRGCVTESAGAKDDVSDLTVESRAGGLFTLSREREGRKI